MTKSQILEKAVWNKDTAYLEQITFIGPDGYRISVVRPDGNTARSACENELVERVKEVYGD